MPWSIRLVFLLLLLSAGAFVWSCDSQFQYPLRRGSRRWGRHARQAGARVNVSVPSSSGKSSDIVEDGALPARVSPDPDDDKYLHTAVVGRASVIVSGDKDLLDLGECEGMRIVTPRRFLGMVG